MQTAGVLVPLTLNNTVACTRACQETLQQDRGNGMFTRPHPKLKNYRQSTATKGGEKGGASFLLTQAPRGCTSLSDQS